MMLFNWHTQEGGYKPLIGRQVTENSVTFYLFGYSLRLRLWGPLPKRVYVRKPYK